MSSRRRQGTSHDVTYRTVWRRPQDVTLGVLRKLYSNVLRTLVEDILNRGSYGDTHRTSFEDVHLPSGKGLGNSPNIMIYLVNQGDGVCCGSKFKYLLKFYEEDFVQVSMKTLEAELDLWEEN